MKACAYAFLFCMAFYGYEVGAHGFVVICLVLLASSGAGDLLRRAR